MRDAQGFGAFVPLNQVIGSGPEALDFVWFYRTNAGGFTTNDPAVQHGTVRGASNSVRFASFSVQWSGNAAGRGWLYYPRDQHGGGGSAGDWAMCITSETNPGVIQADDPRWTYRRRPPFSWDAEKRWLKQWMP